MQKINILEDYHAKLSRDDITDSAEAMNSVREWFGAEVEKRSELGKNAGEEFDNAFRFLENTFGQGQELVIFVTEITAGYDTSWFVENFGCDAYFRHNRDLLFDDTRRRIHNKIAAARAADFDK